MKKFLTLMSFCIMFAMQSCTSDEEPMMPETTESETSISHMVVKFEDRIYETDVMTVGDSVKYLNEEYAEVYQSKIRNNPNIAVVMSSDEVGISHVEYFSSKEKLMEKYEFTQNEGKTTAVLSNLGTRAKVIDTKNENDNSAILGIAELYDDKNFKDTKLICYTRCFSSTSIPYLKDLGFNDKASSIRVYNEMSPSVTYTITLINWPYQETRRGDCMRPVLQCNHNSNFDGAVLYCIAPPTGSSDVHADYNLKSIGWNDRISSVCWNLVKNFSVFEGDNPQIPAHKGC